MRAIGLVLMALAVHAASAADNDARIAALIIEPARNWDVVEAITAAADAAPINALPGRFEGEWGDHQLLLSPDGRMAMPYDEMASIGRWSQDGDWLVLTYEGSAVAPAEPLEPEEIAAARANLLEYYEGMSEDEALDAAEARAAADDDNADGDLPYEEDREEHRLLVVENADGILLLDEEELMSLAQEWPGEGGLELTAAFWRASGPASSYVQQRAADDDFVLADPMHASVPFALRSLLRVQAIEARVVGLADADKAIEWDGNDANVMLRLDRGSDHGLLSGMRMYGLPPHDRLYASIESVTAGDAIISLSISRFAPGDAAVLPDAGTMMASRTARAIGCGIDTRAAVRAAITAVATPEGGVKRDEDGFAYVELEIDQGAHHGLALEDVFRFEGQGVSGEGRVRRLGETTATVLWRAERDWTVVARKRVMAQAAEQFGDDTEAMDARLAQVEAELSSRSVPLQVPALGQHLVTPSWQSVERDVFGKALGDVAPSSPVEVQL